MKPTIENIKRLVARKGGEMIRCNVVGLHVWSIEAPPQKRWSGHGHRIVIRWTRHDVLERIWVVERASAIIQSTQLELCGCDDCIAIERNLIQPITEGICQ